MRFARHLPSLLALPSLVSASFNCEAVQDGVTFDFRALRGPHSVTLPPVVDPIVVRTLLLYSLGNTCLLGAGAGCWIDCESHVDHQPVWPDRDREGYAGG